MEKGGKGLKSSLKTSNGKDSTKKKTRFHPEREAETAFKPVQESDYQFQGVTTAAKGSKPKKGSLARESQPPPELNTEKELPEHAKCMMDCEAFQILQGIKEQMAVLSDDPSIKIPVSFDRGLEYLKYGSCYTNPDSVKQILEPLKTRGISEGEICVIANVCPESIDEVFSFVPSIKGQKDSISEPLQEAVTKLSKIKRSS